MDKHMDSSMANMGQGQVQQTTSGTAVDNVAESNQRGSNAVLQETTGIQKHRKPSTKVKIGLTHTELHRIETALRDHFQVKENEKNDWGELLRKIIKAETKALKKEVGMITWINWKEL